mgnify:CR=1 FL=1
MSPLLFVMCLIPPSLIQRKAKGRHQLGVDSRSINHLLYMDDLKLYGKDERQIDSLLNTVRVFSDDYRNEVWFEEMRCPCYEKGKVVNSEGIDLPDGHRMKTVEEDGYKYLAFL